MMVGNDKPTTRESKAEAPYLSIAFVVRAQMELEVNSA